MKYWLYEKNRNPLHPGEVLDELFLGPLKMSAGALAKRLDAPRTRIERLVKGETTLTGIIVLTHSPKRGIINTTTYQHTGSGSQA